MTSLDEALAARSAMRPDMWADVAGIPTWLEWAAMRAEFITVMRREFSRWISPDQPHFAEQLLFAVGRFDEGAALVRYFALNGHTGPKRVLDLGAGNGGVAFALANCQANSVYTMDIVPNHMIRALRSSLPAPMRPLVATGSLIPLQSNSFDVVLLLDTLEHLPDARSTAAEIIRILRPGGMCMITTPARVRHLFGPDPHYGVRYLAMFPNEMQRFIVNRVMRRRIRTHDGGEFDAYDVEHLFWHVTEIGRLFPAPRRIEMLFNRSYNPGRPSRAWLRHPGLAKEWFAYKMRGFFYDTVLVIKEAH